MANTFLRGSTATLTSDYTPPDNEVGLRIYFPEGFVAGTEFKVLAPPKDDKMTVKIEEAFQSPNNPNLWLSDVIVTIPMVHFGKV